MRETSVFSLSLLRLSCRVVPHAAVVPVQQTGSYAHSTVSVSPRTTACYHRDHECLVCRAREGDGGYRRAKGAAILDLVVVSSREIIK